MTRVHRGSIEARTLGTKVIPASERTSSQGSESYICDDLGHPNIHEHLEYDEPDLGGIRA